jgi:Fe-S cluster biogenesis protein NfuA
MEFSVDNVDVEESPNPDVLLFKPDGFEYEIERVISIPFDGLDSPFYDELVKMLPFVKSLYIHENAIGLAKKSDIVWEEEYKNALDVIVELLNKKIPLISEGVKEKKKWEPGTIEYEISQLLEERVRPAVAQDGGDVELYAFKDGVAYIDLQGACVGCPSSTATLRVGIKRILSHFIDEVKEVETPENM